MLDDEKIQKLMCFTAGRTDYFWKYSEFGPPYLQKSSGRPISLSFLELNEHLKGGASVGFSPFMDSEHVMFGAIDFDAHIDKKKKESKEEIDQKTKRAQNDALKVYEYLKSLHLPVILNSSGSNGRHVRLYCKGMSGKDIRIFLQWVLFKVCGDANKHEIFPKQDDLKIRPFGNQIKAILTVHPKTGQRANIIDNGVLLDFDKSVRYICNIIDNIGTYASIHIPKEAYELFEAKAKVKKIRNKAISKVISTASEGNVPSYCGFLEVVASKKVLPSGGKYNRHACLDPNIAAYGIKHPTVRSGYAAMNDRLSNTAFDNWPRYWIDGKPVFNCSQIYAYLKYHSSNNNKICKRGMNICKQCNHFKTFVFTKRSEDNEPMGWARTFNIKGIAEAYDLLNCPVCHNPFVFNERVGSFSCVVCGYYGGIKKFIMLILKRGII